MSSPFFSVIISTYNRASFIGRTIASVLKQDFEDFELIIVDDGSTDNTKEVVVGIEDKRIRYYKKDNAERGAARNFGAKKASGEYLNFLDSDDLLYDDHLSTAHKIIQEEKPSVFAL
ncbi:MAG: glycosyltransferase family 2 protein, partial [Arenibacter algicola]|nr:glycosyltransferase family 2 protein [Arenibacter algicola]